MASTENAASTSWSSVMGSGAMAGAGFLNSVGASYAAKAQGYLQQASYATQAVETLRLAGLRADKAVEYAQLQADRVNMQTEFEVLNYKVQGNTLLRNLAKTNAAARARAAANGVQVGSGSAMGVQQANATATFRDVGLTDLSAMVARVFGEQDATNILKAGFDNAFYEREAAISNTRAGLSAGGYATQTGGILANASLAEGALGFAKTFPTTAFTSKVKDLFS